MLLLSETYVFVSRKLLGNTGMHIQRHWEKIAVNLTFMPIQGKKQISVSEFRKKAN